MRESCTRRVATKLDQAGIGSRNRSVTAIKIQLDIGGMIRARCGNVGISWGRWGYWNEGGTRCGFSLAL